MKIWKSENRKKWGSKWVKKSPKAPKRMTRKIRQVPKEVAVPKVAVPKEVAEVVGR